MNFTKDAIDAMSNALKKSMTTDELAKAGITTANGITYYDLRTPALVHIPVLTPLRDKMKRTPRPQAGTACNWKVIRSMIGSGFDAMGYLPEGQRSGVRSTSAYAASASYVTLGEEGRVTDQAIRAAQGLEDVRALDQLLTMQKTMLKEENSILGGNRSIKLGTPAVPTATTPANANSTLAAGNFYAAVVALTNEGIQNASLANGVPTSQTVTGADGQTYTVNGGSSKCSNVTAAVAVAAGQSLGLTTPVIPGAVGYAWFVGTANAPGSLYLQGITTINSINLNSVLVAGQTAAAVTQDSSYNDGTQAGSNPVTAYDGLMTSSFLNYTNGNGAYFYAMPTGTAGTGTKLNSNLAGGVVEIENLIVGMWNANKVQVDILMMSANTLKAVTAAILANGATGMLRYDKPIDGSSTSLVGGSRVRAYSSPVGNPYGGDDIPLMIHPNLPDGIIVGWASNLPPFFRNNETPAVAEMLVRQDYYGVEWPKKTLAEEYGVYTDQCLAVYAPWAMGVICNIAV